MIPPLPGPRRAALTRALPVALTLFACGAAGFLVQRLMRPRATLYAAPPAAVRPAVPASEALAPPAAGAPVIPERLPDLALPDIEGRTRRLAEWKGKSLLINFWATWCEPCRREIPLLKRLRRERSGDGLEIVGIAVDQRQAVGAYAAARGIDYPVLVGEQGGLAAARAFGMDTVLPFSVFTTPDGQIIALKVGELHPDEADFILDRVRDLGAGRLSVPAAREAITAAIARLSAARRGSPVDQAPGD